MWRSVASNALTLFIVLLVVAAGLLAWGREKFTGQGPLTEAICFQVERGASLSAVSRSLEKEGAIGDARVFRVGADYSDRAESLKFGSYLIPPQSSMVQVLEILTDGGQSTCGREVNFRIGVAAADVVLRELDPGTNRYVEVVKFDPGVDAVPAAYVEAAEASDLRWRVTLAEGVTSWQVIDALKRADFLEGEVPEVPAEGALAPDSY
ncbi:MAG: endolytic transglycosylase MltG, partial [Paracoccaceae bacterium]